MVVVVDELRPNRSIMRKKNPRRYTEIVTIKVSNHGKTNEMSRLVTKPTK